MTDPKHTIWGTFGDFIFQLMTSPVYGSYTEGSRAKYTSHTRIITRDSDGNLRGQKPLRELAGMELQTIRFSCKISSHILKTLSVSLLGRAALTYGPGPLQAGMVGNLEDDKRFYTDTSSFLATLDAYLSSQEPQELIIGENPKGKYTLDAITKNTLHKPDGSDKIIELDLEFVEWIDE